MVRDTNEVTELALKMLKIKYTELNTKAFKHIDISDCNSVNEVYALVIVNWSIKLAQEGLYKEYIEIENDELVSPRGAINIQQSIAKNTKLHGTLICSYDELSADILLNKYLKRNIIEMITDSNIKENTRISIKKALKFFNEVSIKEHEKYNIDYIKYNNSNIRYKNLIKISNEYIDNKDKTDKIIMYKLFKSIVKKWFKSKYSDIDVSSMDYDMNSDIESSIDNQLWKTNKLVVLQNEKSAVLISIRHTTDKIDNMSYILKLQTYQLVKIAKLFKAENKIKTNCCIVYVNTDNTKLNLEHMNINTMHGVTVGDTVIDIFDFWRYTENKLSECYKYFIERENNRA